MNHFQHPTQQAPDIRELEARHSSGVYNKRDLTIVRGQGARVWDDAGREYVARGVLVLTAGSTVLRLLPPLPISRQELDHVLTAIEETLHEQTL